MWHDIGTDPHDSILLEAAAQSLGRVQLQAKSEIAFFSWPVCACLAARALDCSKPLVVQEPGKLGMPAFVGSIRLD